MNEQQKNKIIRMMVNNDYDWYALLMTDGSVDLKHRTGLSSILECGHDPQRYDIDIMIRCGYDSEEEAEEYLEIK